MAGASVLRPSATRGFATQHRSRAPSAAESAMPEPQGYEGSWGFFRSMSFETTPLGA
jgi:hypothetical protein